MFFFPMEKKHGRDVKNHQIQITLQCFSLFVFIICPLSVSNEGKQMLFF